MTQGPEEEKGRKIGKYEVVGTLGRGSMGVVYKALDPEIGRIVAIKTLRKLLPGALQDADRALERFRNEARSAGKLRHPNIITIFEINREDDQPYIVMDYVEGQTLDRVLERGGGKLPPDLTLHYLSQVAAGLDYAHTQGVIHKDIKPANILIDDQHRVMILDFGIAQINESISEQNPGSSGSSLGTPAYMSPEQVLNERLDARSDLFSLAIVAFQCLTGTRPFPGTNFTEVLSNILNGSILSLTQLMPTLPLALETEFERALSRDKTRRFPNAEGMLSAFSAALGVPYESGRSLIKTKDVPVEWKEPKGTPEGGTAEVPAVAQSSLSAQALGQGAPTLQGGSASLQPSAGFGTSPKTPGDLFRGSGGDDFSFSSGIRAGASPFGVLGGAIGVLAVLVGVGWFIVSLFSGPRESVLAPPASPQNQTSSVAPASPGETAFEELESPSVDSVPKGKRVAELTDRQLLGVLVAADSQEETILEAISEGVRRKSPGLVEALVYPLGSESYVVRVATIKAVAQLGDKRIVPRLLTSLDDHDPLVRGHAAKALGILGDRRALPYLASKMMVEDAPEAKTAMKNAIEKMNGFPVNQ